MQRMQGADQAGRPNSGNRVQAWQSEEEKQASTTESAAPPDRASENDSNDSDSDSDFELTAEALYFMNKHSSLSPNTRKSAR